MKQEEKELLLKDLCARLSYGVKVKVTPVPSEEYNHIFFNGKIVCIDTDYIGVLSDNGFVLQQDIIELKPYLFPLSNMTEEQEIEYDATFDTIVYEDGRKDSVMTYKSFDWLNANHFDYRGLIEKGLANDATGLNIY